MKKKENEEDMNESKSVAENIGWKFLERGASLAVSFSVTIALSRILSPDDYGLIALITVFVSITTIFVTTGTGAALIQKKDADELDFSSFFWLNLVISIGLYLILFLLAPLIAKYYGYPELRPMLRVLSLSIPVSAVNSIQGAYISRNMMFRYYFFSTLSSKIASGVIGIGMAIRGFGAWALVWQSLSLITFEAVVLWFRVKWRPTRQFSKERAKRLIVFSWQLALMGMTESLGDQLRSLIIGKTYSASDLAYYNKGVLLPNTIITNITSSLSAVMFPVISKVQDEKERVRQILSQWISLFAYTAFPLLTGLAIAGKNVIVFLFTEKWTPSVPYLALACIVYGAWIIEVPIRETIKSLGYAKICFRIQLIKTAFTIFTVILSARYGVFAIALSASLCALVNIGISAFYGNKYVRYRPGMLLKDVAPSFFLCAVMAAAIFLLSLIVSNRLLCLCAQVIVGIAVYWLTSVLTKNSSYTFLCSLIKSKIHR